MLPSGPAAMVLDRILAVGIPHLVVFETPGCAPCEQLRPTLDQLAGEFRDRVLVVRVVDSAEGWLAARYHLSFVPTLLFWRGGVEHCRIKGDPGRAAIRAHLDFLLTGDVPARAGGGAPAHAGGARSGVRAGGRSRGLCLPSSEGARQSEGAYRHPRNRCFRSAEPLG